MKLIQFVKKTRHRTLQLTGNLIELIWLLSIGLYLLYLFSQENILFTKIWMSILGTTQLIQGLDKFSGNMNQVVRWIRDYNEFTRSE
jgi:hypothetical protein